MLSVNINRYIYVLNINKKKKKKFKVKLLTNENMFEKIVIEFWNNFLRW